MINLNDIKCVLKDIDAINNIMNIFFYHLFKKVPINMWVIHCSLWI